ncbi:SH3 domain-containing protein [Streptomyces sp. NPDC014006]|uniref:SH3 domain-containing protein n=1 Tax=Streptomyces sp. NPDC014006 TaxID=3364870 RepID=UPI003700894D
MSHRPRLSRFAIAAATVVFVSAVAGTPAFADDGWGQDDPSASSQGGGNGGDGGDGGDGGSWQQGGGGGNDGNWQQQGGDGGGNGGNSQQQGGEGGGNGGNSQQQGGEGGDGGSWQQGGGGHESRLARGRVTAGTLLLRSAPERGSQVIRTAHRGEIVSIYCQTRGQSVEGNRLWYLLTDGTWAWGSARYIQVLGSSPRWC